MGVGIEGEGDGGVTEAFADGLGVGAGTEHEGGGSVAKVVEAKGFEVGAFHDRGEGAVEVAGGEGFAGRTGEDEVVVLPGGTEGEPGFVLEAAMFAEHLDG